MWGLQYCRRWIYKQLIVLTCEIQRTRFVIIKNGAYIVESFHHWGEVRLWVGGRGLFRLSLDYLRKDLFCLTGPKRPKRSLLLESYNGIDLFKMIYFLGGITGRKRIKKGIYSLFKQYTLVNHRWLCPK